MKKAGVLSVLVLLAVAVIAEAQQPKKVPRIGYLSGSARLKVDIIVAAGGINVIRAAKNATKTIPIVMGGSGIDPVVAGLVESLARPGSNVTGITNLSRELGGKRLDLLKEAVPKVASIAVLYESANPGSLRELKEILPVAARALGLTVRSWEIRDAASFDKVFAAVNKERPDGLYLTTSPLMTANVKSTARLCLKEPVAISRQRHICGCRWSDVLRRGLPGRTPSRSHLRRQDPEGCQARPNCPLSSPPSLSW